MRSPLCLSSLFTEKEGFTNPSRTSSLLSTRFSPVRYSKSSICGVLHLNVFYKNKEDRLCLSSLFLRRRRDLRTHRGRRHFFPLVSLPVRNSKSSICGVLHRFTFYKKEAPPIGDASFFTEKEGFEPSRRYSRPTPLAGAPLRPLEYFSSVATLILPHYRPFYNTFNC